MAIFGKQLVGINLSMYQIQKDDLFLSGSTSEDGKGEGRNQGSDTQLVHTSIYNRERK